MAKYIDSFKKGISAAKDAERNREEVDSVFEELNRQLGLATENKVVIQRRELTVPVDIFKGIIYPRETYWALVAVSPKKNNAAPAFTELAKWDQDSAGYPCRVSFGSNSYSCEDKAALEQVLEALLADAAVGEVLYKYITAPLTENDQ